SVVLAHFTPRLVASSVLHPARFPRLFFFSCCSAHPRHLHSFPTRRSSDLAVGVGVVGTGLDRRLGGLGRRERDGSGGLGLGCGGGGGGLGGRLALRGGLVDPRGGGRERRRDRGGGEDSEDAHLHR